MTPDEKLILSALRFRATKLWEKLDDKMIFGVKLPDGDIMYCCVMGNGGEYYGLGTYKGKEGFATYLKSLTLSNLDRLEQFETTMTFDCINVNYVNANDKDLNPEVKTLVKNVVKDNNLKMNRPNGWPAFVKMAGNIHSFILTEKDDIINVTAALEGAIEVASKVKDLNWIELGQLGFQIDDIYPSAKGGMTIPLLTPDNDGTFSWSTTATPPLHDASSTPVKFNDKKLASDLKSIKHKGTLQAKIIHSALPFGHNDRMEFVPILSCIDKVSGDSFPVMNTDEDVDSRQGVLLNMANIMLDSKHIPATIEVFDNNTQSLLADFCKQAGIMLVRGKKSKDLDELCNMLYNYFSILR